MIKYILRHWLRNKKIFLTSLIGASLICSGLSILIGLSETNQGTIIDTLQKKWKASYDIVVRPTDSKELLQEGLLDPNYLSGLSGGISIGDWREIQEIDDVAVAAPISMIGYTMTSISHQKVKVDPGIYRLTTSVIENDGARKSINSRDTYYATGFPVPFNAHEFGLFSNGGGGELSFENYANVLIAAVDPEEEAKLIGLDEAVVNQNSSRYFNQSDKAEVNYHEGMDADIIKIPVLFNYRPQNQQQINHTLSKLNIPFDSGSAAKETVEKIKNNGGLEYLESIPESSTKEFTLRSDEAYKNIIEYFTKETPQIHLITEKPSSLEYTTINSPFPNRWKFAFEIDDPEIDLPGDIYNAYRKQITYSDPIRVIPEVVGFYNPSDLQLSIDPINEVPMETYRSATATLVLNKNEQPINPPIDLTATTNPYGYIMKPPSMLTTIDAAEEIMGDYPISAIRIKIRGVDELNNVSQNRLEQVVQEIEDNTGLKADITLGSSPKPLLIHIPNIDGEDELGWMEQPWLKSGASYGIFRETKLGYSGLIVLLIIVSIIYVFATNLVSYLSRKKEFAVLQALGWKRKRIRAILLTESMLIGAIVSLATLVILFIMRHNMEGRLGISHIITITIFILLIYLVGAICPSYLVSKINPTQILKQGEISVKGARLIKIKGLLTLVFNTIIGRWPRNLISILSIGLPSGLFMMFIFVSIRLEGTMYTTWLGQYVSLNVGTPHYISVAVCLLISILTTYEIMWQNLQERIKEISLFKSVGWKNSTIRISVILEGAIIGFLAAIVGIIVSLVFLMIMYGSVPISESWIFAISFIFPVIIGIVGAWIPAKRAMKFDPNVGLKYE